MMSAWFLRGFRQCFRKRDKNSIGTSTPKHSNILAVSVYFLSFMIASTIMRMVVIFSSSFYLLLFYIWSVGMNFWLVSTKGYFFLFPREKKSGQVLIRQRPWQSSQSWPSCSSCSWTSWPVKKKANKKNIQCVKKLKIHC